MSIEVTCDGCGSRFKVADEAAGKKGKCKKCGAIVRVPQPAASAAADEPDDLYGMAEPAPTHQSVARPAAAVPPPPPHVAGAGAATMYNPAQGAMMAHGVVPPGPNAGSWKNSGNPPPIMAVLKGVGGAILLLLGLLLMAVPIMAMMGDTTGKTIRFRGIFLGLFLVVTGGGLIAKAFGWGGDE